MSLFSDIGRKFEKAKKSLTDTEQSNYVCISCEKSLDENYEYCPDCGEESVEAVA